MMARPRKRAQLEDGLRLDVNKLRVQAIPLGKTTQRVICWGPRYSGHARTIGLVIFRLDSATHGWMRLLVGAAEQSVDLVALPRHFGGQQWYFRCPVLGRRASVLWLPRGASSFASREALGSQFAYASQFQTPIYRAHLRAHQIHCRLSGEDRSPIYHILPPTKPKYMHHNTYKKLLERLFYAESKYKLPL
jgi:hypothetical protein